MIEYVNIDDVRPADYNPRLLTEEAKKNLLESISVLGMIKPIVLRRSDKRVIAGHQRTKCLKELGNIQVPCFYVENVSSEDEVRFNQLHNRLEVEIKETQPKIVVNTANLIHGEFVKVKNSEFKIVSRGDSGANIRSLSDLINKYGEFGSCVCDNEGNVIVSAVYAATSILLGLDVYVYMLNAEETEYAKATFGKVVKYQDLKNSFQCYCIKTKKTIFNEFLDGLKFEFTMILPKGHRYNLFEPVYNALKPYYE